MTQDTYGTGALQFDVLPALRHAVLDVFENYENYEWTVQGFGFLRCYPFGDKAWRVNVWDKRLSIPGVSVIHNHPWHLKSWVLAGRFLNQRYGVTRTDDGATHEGMQIKTGVTFDPEKDKGAVQRYRLTPQHVEEYGPGAYYTQHYSETHHTDWDGIAVTINCRHVERGASPDHASVYWPVGESWVDAKPRVIFPLEMQNIIFRARDSMLVS